MLAPAEQKAAHVQAPRQAEVVVCVRAGPDPADPAEAARTGQRVGQALTGAWAGRSAVVLLLREGDGGAPPAPVGQAGAAELIPWSHPGQGELEAMLRAVEAFGAAGGALVSPGPAPEDAACCLLRPVLEGCELAVPWYATQRWDGVLSTGLVYPTLRALFGQRLRFPLAPELAVGRRLAGHLLAEAWQADPAYAGEPLWLVAAALAGGFTARQCHLGPPPRRGESGQDLSAALAQVVGALFHATRRLAPVWQRQKGSRAVPEVGEPRPLLGDAGQPPIGPMRQAFQLGYQELGRIWGAVLPPRSLLALRGLARAPEEAFAFDDALWARVVYDFTVAYHLATMDRALLLRSMTPLYLGWVAGWVREVQELDAAAAEARVERLCRAFEGLKPYLIQRWRWPDRFNP